jgi:uncharacterized membrane protein (UPF0127 family)
LRVYRLLLFSALIASPFAHAANANSYSELAQSTAVIIQTESAEHRFCTEVATHLDALRQGLKHRRHLGSDDSMLFLFDPPKQVQFWMKDTYISLDMLFFDQAGRIVSIAERTQPFSLDLVGPATPVRGVLEINGGLSRQLNIRTGNRIVWKNENDCRMKTSEK